MRSRFAAQASVGLLLALWAAPSEAVPATWLAGTGNWSDPTRWDTNPLYPCNGNGGQSYDAIIASGTATLDLTCSLENFTFSGGALAGSFDLSVNQLFSWSGGSLGGSGLVTASSGVALTGTGTKSFTGTRGLNIAGSSAWSGGNINLGTGGVTLRNQGTLSVSGATGRSITDSSPNGSFLNEGSFTLALAGAGNLLTVTPNSIGQSGAVHVNTGILSWNGNGSYTGSFDGTGTLRFSGGTQALASGASVTVADTEVTSGTLSVQSGATFAVANLDIGNGTLSVDAGVTATAGTASQTTGTLGGAGTLESSGLYSWSGGTMSGSGTTRALAGAAISGASTKILAGTRSLNLVGGSSSWSAGIISLGLGGATLRNQSGSTLLVTGPSFRTLSDSNGSGRFANQGTLTVQLDAPANLVSIQPGAIEQDGAVHVNTGILGLGGNGSYTGSFDGAGTLRFTSDVQELAAGSSVTTTAAELLGGTTTVQPGATFDVDSLSIQTGTLAVIGTLSTGTLNEISGTLSGAGDVEVSGLLTWSGGTMSGSGTTHAPGGAALSGAATKVFAGTRTLALEGGSSSWTAGSISLGGEGATLRNEAGSTLAVTGASRSFSDTIHSASLLNQGTLTLSLSSPTQTLNVSALDFTQSGTLDLVMGTLTFLGTTTFTQTAGLTRLEDSTLRDLSAPLHFQGGVLDGTGLVQADVQSSAVISPGLSAGTITVDGDLTLLPGGELRSELGGTTQGSQYDFVSVSGSGALAGSLTAGFLSGFQNTVTPADTFTLLDAASPLTGAFSNVASGQRVLTPPEWDSVVVSYGAGSSFGSDRVVLHDFRAFAPVANLHVTGTAQGGTVTLVVAGQTIVVTTQAGWTPAQVAEAIAEAIRAVPALTVLGIAGVATGPDVGVNSGVGGVPVVTDPGINVTSVVDVPALPGLGALALCGGLAAAAARALRARRRDAQPSWS